MPSKRSLQEIGEINEYVGEKVWVLIKLADGVLDSFFAYLDKNALCDHVFLLSKSGKNNLEDYLWFEGEILDPKNLPFETIDCHVFVFGSPIYSEIFTYGGSVAEATDLIEDLFMNSKSAFNLEIEDLAVISGCFFDLQITKEGVSYKGPKDETLEDKDLSWDEKQKFIHGQDSTKNEWEDFS